jgi:ribosomal protein S18 acetylase RimI-like enzyme
VNSRPYTEPHDLRAMQRLALEVWRLDPTLSQATVGELAWSTRQHVGREPEWKRRLWLEGSEVVAWAWISVPSTLKWQVHPAQPALIDDVLDWFEVEADEGQLETSVRTDDDRALEALRRRGYVEDPDAPWFLLNVRDLDEIEEPRLPRGYRLTTMQEAANVSARVAVHRAAWFPSRVTEESYENVRRTWPYREDLDCIVQAPDGSFAAYALAWLDVDNSVGEFEPVGTHPDHRRCGLARAVSLFGLQRLRALGATKAIVLSRGDAKYPIPKLLYESVGFRELSRSQSFARKAAARGS